LFDFGTDNVGKPIGIDLQEKKLTLPLIHALDQSPAVERRKIYKIIRKSKKNGQDLKDVNAFVVRYGGIVYAQQLMRTYANKARSILLEFPDTIYRQALLDLVQFTVQRRK
jgi:octaprenyl-diphosphate synthase